MHPVFFLHPPKCGGSSVVSFFNLNKGGGSFVNFEGTEIGLDKNLTRLQETGVGGGHTRYGVHKILKTPLNYCTILRDPLARQISHYYYALNGKNGEVNQGASVSAAEGLVARGIISLDEWVAESLDGGNVFCSILSDQPFSGSRSLEIARMNLKRYVKTLGVCEDMSSFLLRLCGNTGLRLPFYIESNKTKSRPEKIFQLSETARQKFMHENRFDYELFKYANDLINNDTHEGNDLFRKAVETVREVQAAIDLLENPYIYASTMSDFDNNYLAKVRKLVATFDLTSVEEYLFFSENNSFIVDDMYAGYVESVKNGVVSGWATNLTQHEKDVLVEIRVSGEVVATGLCSYDRPDVASAGFPTSRAGFRIHLPDCAQEGFQVTIAESHELLNNHGFWSRTWHCSGMF